MIDPVISWFEKKEIPSIETITVAPLGSHVVKKSDTALIVLQLFQHGDQFSDKKVGWGSLEARGPYS